MPGGLMDGLSGDPYAGVGAVVPGGIFAVPMGLASKALGRSYLRGAVGGHATRAGMGAYAAGTRLPQIRADRILEDQPGAFPTYGYGQRR